MDGTVSFECDGKSFEIPYSFVEWRGDGYLCLTDRKGCLHPVYFEGGRWELLWKERFPEAFRDALDEAIRSELGR